MTDREHEALLRRISKRLERRSRAQTKRAQSMAKAKLFADAAACHHFAVEALACSREVLKLTRALSPADGGDVEPV